MSMIRLHERQWKNQIILSGILFQIIFLFEILIFHDVIIVDPSVHNISYENWMWFVLEWKPPEYWINNSEVITITIGIINTIFQIIFSINIIYIFAKISDFSLQRKRFLLAIGGIIISDIIIRHYIKQNVSFYRLYMYSIYNELTSIFMIYCGKKAKK